MRRRDLRRGGLAPKRTCAEADLLRKETEQAVKREGDGAGQTGMRDSQGWTAPIPDETGRVQDRAARPQHKAACAWNTRRARIADKEQRRKMMGLLAGLCWVLLSRYCSLRLQNLKQKKRSGRWEKRRKKRGK